MEITEFDTEDVISTSGENDPDLDEDDLPFVPATNNTP